MRRISIANLEAVRKNPILFAKSLKDGSQVSSTFGGQPKSMRWLNAVNKFHTTNSISKAEDVLIQSFSNRNQTPKNLEEQDHLIESLNRYIAENNSSNYIFLDTRVNINLPLTSILKISGWIWIINKTENGNIFGYFVSRDVGKDTWKEELRFPIIQHYIATHYRSKISKISVGLIDYTTGERYHKRFSQKEIDNAITELNTIGHQISEIIHEN